MKTEKGIKLLNDYWFHSWPVLILRDYETNKLTSHQVFRRTKRSLIKMLFSRVWAIKKIESVIYYLRVFLSCNWIQFSGSGPSYFIEMKSQVAKFDLVQVIKLVISHNDNLMAVMRFALDRTKARKAAEFFKWSVCLQCLIYELV